MQIYGPSQLHGPQGINPPHGRNSVQLSPPQSTSIGGDRLELSEAAQVASRLTDAAQIRQDRVTEIRQSIAAGTYETEGKLDAALDRFLDEIG
jgi:negative regulator of flagellin synthesis FlgM